MPIALIITSAVLLIVLAIVVFIYTTERKRIIELKEKTDFALKQDVMLKIEMKDHGLLSMIAANFNQLIRMVQELTSTKSSLEKESGKLREMDHKIRNFEESISQTNMLVDLGMQITSSLDTDDILHKVYNFISSSMDMEEIELMHFTGDQRNYRMIDRRGKLTVFENVEDRDRENILNWALENRKELILNDAQKDYAQYVFKPIIGLSGSRPNSLVCIPLVLHDHVIGAIAVGSLKKDTYNKYHVDFIRGIASYISVAIDNANVYRLLDASKQEIESEKDKSDVLLLNILPAEVADELKQKGFAEARRFSNVSVLFSDFQNFTGISEKLSPEELVSELNIYFKAFDDIVEKYKMEKIKTIGDAYMAAGGMSGNGEASVRDTVLAGLEMQEFVWSRAIDNKKKKKPSFNMRVGIHTGPVVAGIVGAKKFQYDIWGDTVNTASRMESSSQVDKVNISEATYDFIRNDGSFRFSNRGEIRAKHKGEITMFFVERNGS